MKGGAGQVWWQEIARQVHSWANAGLAFFYPEICQICSNHRAGPSEGYICSGCRETVKGIEEPICSICGRPVEGAITGEFECYACKEQRPAFLRARSAAAAGETLLQAIHLYKYKHGLWVEPFLADLLIRKSVADIQREGWAYVMPVPLHPVKQRERGFNQAERLAVRLAEATGLKVETRVLQRIVHTPSQTALSRKERQKNMEDAFRVRKHCRLSGERILLVDDVFTTGATTNECAKALRAAGAGDVCVWTVARGV